eukprot:794520-Pyramimonas_sp.AAC.1
MILPPAPLVVSRKFAKIWHLSHATLLTCSLGQPGGKQEENDFGKGGHDVEYSRPRGGRCGFPQNPLD